MTHNKLARIVAIAGAVLAIVPIAAFATPAAKPAAKKPVAKTAVATKYECSKCHMQYSAAEAKKLKYKCDMDGGKLVPMKSTSAKTKTPAKM